MVEKPLVIEVDTGKRCTRCLRYGALKNGLCLMCRAKELTEMADKTAKDVVQGDGEIIDVHPRMKTFPDGRSERFTDVKIRIPHVYPETIALLSGLLNTSVTFKIAPVQISLIEEGKGK